MKSIFPQEMMSTGEMTMESIAGKLTYFHEALHLIHWQTDSYATHMALGSLYDYVHDFKDGVIEKLMGYTGTKIKSLSIPPVGANSAYTVVSELLSFANSLGDWARSKKYNDISNLADSLSGEAAKTLYLLTLS